MASAPSVSTISISGVAAVSAVGAGNVTSDGGATITDRGVVVGTSVNPTTANSKFAVSGTTGAYNAAITGLSGATIYHARAYAVNAQGTSYGSDIQFKTTPVLTNKTKSSVAGFTNQVKN